MRPECRFAGTGDQLRNEGVLRVTIFALPWLAILASGVESRVTLKWPWALGLLWQFITLTSHHGETWPWTGGNVVRPSQVSAIEYSRPSAPKGATLIGLELVRFTDLTANYRTSLSNCRDH